jgi:hypothetical protein
MLTFADTRCERWIERGIWAFAYVLLAAVFFSLIFSELENNLKISLK